MCGIVGMFGINGRVVDPKTVDRMSRALAHRGPDAEDSYVSGSTGLGFRRLSIIDLSSNSDQPMYSSDKRYVVVFNGEIYNFIELRDELVKKGHVFRSTGDTEVLLYSFLEWGYECLSRLNGMWAFLIYDSVERIIFGSRDRFGVKPLYRYESKSYSFYASEIKAIIASGFYSGGPNWHAVAKYLYQGRLDDEEESFFDGIVRIPAGHAFTVNSHGKYTQWRYWSINDRSYEEVVDPVGQFLEIFDDSVKLRLRSDVPEIGRAHV